MANLHVPLEDVVSSNLSAYGYDRKRSIAAVRFKNGRIIHYAGVPAGVWARWQADESKGRFYATQIKGKYEGALMTGECPKCGAMGWLGEQCHDCGCATFALPPKHFVMPDEPSAASKRVQHAVCGGHVSPRDVAENAADVTCSRCKGYLEERDSMEV